MLDVFRKKGLSTVVYGVIIVGMVLVFVIQFNPSAGKKTASLKQACVATVRGWCIDPKDHQAAFRMLAPRDGRTLSAGQTSQLKKFALDGLIERELLLHEADRLGVTVSESEVTDSIFDGILHVSVPSDDPSKAAQIGAGDGRRFVNFRDTKTKVFDVKVYERTIKNLVGRSPTEFREEQQREILAAKMRDLIRTPVRVSEVEAEGRYIDEKSSAQVDSWMFKNDYFGRWGVAATDGAVADFMKDQTQQGAADSLFESRKKDSLPVVGHIRHILINLPKAKTSPGSAADAEEDKVDPAARALTLARISTAMARIKAGEAFADVARDVSEDKGSALRGGDVGDKTDSFVPEFKAAADALKPGEITPEAIETTYGYHLIERDNPDASAAVEAALKKDAAKDVYIKAKALDVAKAAATQFTAAVKNGQTPEAALLAVEQGLASESQNKKAAPLIGVKARPVAAPAVDAADAGASTDSMDAAASTSAMSADASTKPQKKAPPAPAPVVTFDATTDPDRPTVDTSTSFNKTGEAFPSVTGEASQHINAFAFSAKENELLAEPMKVDEGFVVLRLKQQKKATKDEFEKDHEMYEAGLLSLAQAEALATYVKRLRDGAKDLITIDDSYIHPVGRDGGAAPVEEDEDQP